MTVNTFHAPGIRRIAATAAVALLCAGCSPVPDFSDGPADLGGTAPSAEQRGPSYDSTSAETQETGASSAPTTETVPLDGDTSAEDPGPAAEPRAETAILALWDDVAVAAESGSYSRPSGSHGGSCPGQHVDHVVPLKEARLSGLTVSELREFNRYAGNHRCLPASVNTSKGSSEPHEWLSKPKAGAYFRASPSVFCEFVSIWVRVKNDWDMTADAAEHRAVRSILVDDCDGSAVPVLSGPGPATPRGSESRGSRGDASTSGTCVHWHSGHKKHTHPGTGHDGTHHSGKCAGF